MADTCPTGGGDASGVHRTPRQVIVSHPARRAAYLTELFRSFRSRVDQALHFSGAAAQPKAQAAQLFFNLHDFRPVVGVGVDASLCGFVLDRHRQVPHQAEPTVAAFEPASHG